MKRDFFFNSVQQMKEIIRISEFLSSRVYLFPVTPDKKREIIWEVIQKSTAVNMYNAAGRAFKQLECPELTNPFSLMEDDWKKYALVSYHEFFNYYDAMNIVFVKATREYHPDWETNLPLGISFKNECIDTGAYDKVIAYLEWAAFNSVKFSSLKKDMLWLLSKEDKFIASFLEIFCCENKIANPLHIPRLKGVSPKCIVWNTFGFFEPEEF